MIGLCGSHRTGKSTIAEAFAKEKGIAWIKSEASRVLEEKGLSLSANLPFEARLDAQRHILDAAEKTLRTAAGPFISDRTPLDMAAYLMADVMKGTVYGETVGQVESYLADCFQITNAYFDRIVLVPPGIPYAEEPGKPPFDVGYQEHHHLLCVGLLCDYRCDVPSVQLDRGTLSLSERLNVVEDQWQEILEDLKEANKAGRLH